MYLSCKLNKHLCIYMFIHYEHYIHIDTLSICVSVCVNTFEYF